jgi:phosphoribosylformylglycinamidine synthase
MNKLQGKLIINGVEETQSLFQMVMATQDTSNANNVIKFCDNSR